LKAGRLGTITVKGDQVMLGAPFVFNKSNIDAFDFVASCRNSMVKGGCKPTA
jgi:hypothetical protein